jgi:acetamidase/formamidase
MNQAVDQASWSMIELLQKAKGLPRLDAYALASIAMDCRIGEVAAADKSIHCLVPKSLWAQH